MDRQSSGDPKEALSLLGVSKSYGGRPVLEEISLSLRLGEIYALTGPNGSGKTTLIRMATGLAFPSKGRILLFGEDVHKTPSAKRNLGAVVEAPAAFYPHLTGRQNLERHAYLLGLTQKEPFLFTRGDFPFWPLLSLNGRTFRGICTFFHEPKRGTMILQVATRVGIIG